MNKLFSYIKEKFITKAFLIFCIIGVLNTVINFFVLKGVLTGFSLIYKVDSLDELSTDSFEYLFSVGVSTLVAFVAASIFSYYANAKFTYKEKTNGKNALLSAITFVVRYLLTYLFTLLFYYLVKEIFNVIDDPGEWIKTIVNTVVSLALVPPFYLVFKLIFKGKEKE